MSSLGWFYLLMLRLPQVSYGQVQGSRDPEKQHSVSKMCKKLLPKSAPIPSSSPNDYSLLLSLLQQQLFSPFFSPPFFSPQDLLFPLTLPFSQGIITK